MEATIPFHFATPANPRRRKQACNHCRSKKIKCAGDLPCANCIDHDQRCVYPAKRTAKQRKVSDGVQKSASNQQIHSGNFHASSSSGFTAPAAAYVSQNLDRAVTERPPEAANIFRHKPTSSDIAVSQPSGSDGQNVATVQTWSGIPSLSPDLSDSDQVTSTSAWHEAAPPSPKLPMVNHEDAGVYSESTAHLEYLGPRSKFSIFSKPAIEWVKRRAAQPDYAISAGNVLSSITYKLKIGVRPSPTRVPEPSSNDAWVYTKAYFDEAVDAGLGIVHRPWFESRLTAFIAREYKDEDAAWYALRNIIYAYGCRIELSKTNTCQKAQQVSWPYFENALSVHTDVLFLHPSVIGVQALTVMAYYTEGSGSPFIQYMLCSSAMRLAVAKGLHRQAGPSWGLPPQEEVLRNCTFWALHCLDTSIASRSGRPASIDADEVTCPMPRGCVGDVAFNPAFSTATCKFMRLASIALKKLSTAQTSRQTPQALAETVAGLDAEVKDLKETLKSIVNIDAPLNPARLPDGLNLWQVLSIRFMYYYILLDIHTTFTYPWLRTMMRSGHPSSFQVQADKSIGIVADMSRRAIMDCRFVTIDANCPWLLSMFVPLYAVGNLFIHILRYPLLESTTSDVTYMDLAIGHFAHLEVATNAEVAVSFVRDLAQIARNAISNAKNVKEQAQDASNMSEMGQSGLLSNSAIDPWSTNEPIMAEGGFVDHSAYGLPFNNDLDMWSVMLPMFDQESSFLA